MGRTQGPTARQLLTAAVVVLAILALLPPRWGAWVRGFRGVALALSAPVSAVVRRITPDPAGPPAPEAIAQLERERDLWKTRFYQEQARAAELERRVERLARATLHTDLGVRLIAAPVIGGSSDPSGEVLIVRAGKRQGVERNAVATLDGVQLIGLVESSGASTCTVRLLTHKSFGRLDGVVLVGEGEPLECTLAPTGDGALAGQVSYKRPPGHAGALEARVGQEVRLDDKTGRWPRSARMLLLGYVEEVRPAPDQPLRQFITVRPTVALERVGEVILRVPTPIGDAAEGEDGAG